MALGYDESRPKAENYSSFLEKFVSGLEKIGNKELSFMIYGSYVRGESDFGRSDIDALLIFPNDVVTDKEEMSKISELVAFAQRKNKIPLELTPVDLRTMSDGRFNSYDPSFERYFVSEGKILFGPDYKNNFRFELPKMPDQESVKTNLWMSRRALIMSEWQRQLHYTKFLDGFDTTLRKASRASKQILGMMDGKLRLNRFSALEEIEKIFPQVDSSPLKKIRHLFKNLDELDKIYKHPDEVIEIWKSSVTFFEQIIKVYLDANPRSQ